LRGPGEDAHAASGLDDGHGVSGREAPGRRPIGGLDRRTKGAGGMINVEEHVYADDPLDGHPDVRTRLTDASYFFVGNGLIQAAVQIAPAGEGTPLGLIIMDPEALAPKRAALTFDPMSGFENTLMRFRLDVQDAEIRPGLVKPEWYFGYGVPAVRVAWSAGELSVTEIFFCPDLDHAHLIREVRVEHLRGSPVALHFVTGVRGRGIGGEIVLPTGQEGRVQLRYALESDPRTVTVVPVYGVAPSEDARRYWQGTADISFGAPRLDRYYAASRFQLPAVVSRAGRVDAGIWQYNREWVRDNAFMAIGLTLSGHHDLAGRLLRRLLTEFVTDEGGCIDSSERRDPEDVELDQNGTLLHALKSYVVWSGDHAIVRENWDRIKKTAEYPLAPIFRHPPSGMLCNARDYWERHRAHGIEPGLELMYQVFPAIGLDAAAGLARLIGREAEAATWEAEARRLRRAVLHHPEFALVDDRGFVKRRHADGPVQETVMPREDAGLPLGVPLASRSDHRLDPDTATALPVALGFVPPDSEVAVATLNRLESLWNQGWDGGGYGRYHLSSEPDSPGPWPFASLFLARAWLENGDFEKVERILAWLDSIPGSVSGAWFETYGPRIAPPYAQVGITPWTWSEMIVLFVHHMLGLRPEANHLRVRPRLLPGLEHVTATVPLRGHAIRLDLRRAARDAPTTFETNVKGSEPAPGEIHLPYPEPGEDIVIAAEI